jgi:hypothetical protein
VAVFGKILLSNKLTLTNRHRFEYGVNEQAFLFQELASRKIVADFGGGYLSSDWGGIFLGELEVRSGPLLSLGIDRLALAAH